jgi:hypothetical protein
VVVLQPDVGVDYTIVLGDVVGRLEALREFSVLDPSPEGLRPRGLDEDDAIEAPAPALALVLVVVISSASARMTPSRGLLLGAVNLLDVVLPTLARRLSFIGV